MKKELITGIYEDAIKIQEFFEDKDCKQMNSKSEELCKKFTALKLEKSFVNFPDNINLPFFAYGIFKPGQLSYSKIRDCVDGFPEEHDINHEMRFRDGIPFILKEENEQYKTKGFLIKFNEEDCEKAYREICKSEPDALYYWGKIDVNGNLTNVLIGRSPNKGSYIDRSKGKIGNYQSKEDPFFSEAIEVIEEDLFRPWNPHKFIDFFNLQMKYMLLWSSIERYCSFKYEYGSINQNLNRFANNKTFIDSLKGKISPNEEILIKLDNDEKLSSNEENLKFLPRKNPRKVYSSQNLNEEKLDPMNSKKSIHYYYTIRCNITHRGKSQYDDKEMLFPSLVELLNIFKAVLNDEFI